MSTPTTRSTLNGRKEFVPVPSGCMQCFTRENITCPSCGSTGSGCGHSSRNRSCQHEKHFVAMKTWLKDHGFSHVGAGSFRSTWERSVGSKFVVKVPHGHDGYCDNYFEALAWMEQPKVLARSSISPNVLGAIGHRIARCSMHPSGLLVMEKLKDANNWSWDKLECMRRDESLNADRAAQFIWGMDGGQGGFDPTGRFKLFDFTHRAEIAPEPNYIEAL